MRHTTFADLEAGRVDPASFSHRDHLACGFEALQQDEFFEAASRFARALRKLTTLAGQPEKYNATVTFAFLSLIAERMQADENTETFMDRNSDLLGMKKLRALYGPERLQAPLARSVPLLPQA